MASIHCIYCKCPMFGDIGETVKCPSCHRSFMIAAGFEERKIPLATQPGVLDTDAVEIARLTELLAAATEFRVLKYIIRQHPIGEKLLWFVLRNDVAHPWLYHTGHGWPTAEEAVSAAKAQIREDSKSDKII